MIIITIVMINTNSDVNHFHLFYYADDNNNNDKSQFKSHSALIHVTKYIHLLENWVIFRMV